MSDISQGLTISFIGILITFAFFGALMLLIVLLREIFKVTHMEKDPKLEEAEGQDTLEQSQDIYRMKAAGIAVLVATMKQRTEPSYGLGKVLETPPGEWWHGTRHEKE